MGRHRRRTDRARRRAAQAIEGGVQILLAPGEPHGFPGVARIHHQDGEAFAPRAERRRAFLAGEGDVSSPVHERLDDPAEGEAAADGASAGRTFSPSVKFPASVGEPSESLSAAPHADGLDVRPAGQRPISRKQRRARRRLLEKLRRKAK